MLYINFSVNIIFLYSVKVFQSCDTFKLIITIIYLYILNLFIDTMINYIMCIRVVYSRVNIYIIRYKSLRICDFGTAKFTVDV